MGPLSIGGGDVRPGLDGETDARDTAVRVAAVGLLAARAVYELSRQATCGFARDASVTFGHREDPIANAVGGVVHGHVVAQGPSIAVSEFLPISSRIANALVSYVAYLGQFFCPAGLAAFYPHPEDGLPTWKIVGALVVLGGVSFAAWIGRRRFPCLLVGWLWYLGMLVPAIGLVQVGDQARADRYTYLPGIGLCLALAWGMAQLSLSWPHRRWLCGAASALAVVTLAAIAWRQTSYWRDSETLWNRALACTTHNATAQYNLGVTLAQRGDAAGAIKCFQATLAIQPRSADAENNLGVLLAGSGRLDEAAGHFQAALRIRPDLVSAYNNLRVAIQQQSQFRRTTPP